MSARLFAEVVSEHGLPVAVSFFFVFASAWLVKHLLNQALDGKDQEIARLASNRDRLLDELLVGDRPSSTEPPRRIDGGGDEEDGP